MLSEMHNDEALPLATEVRRKYRALFGDDHEETLDATETLSGVHTIMGNSDAALPLAREALAARRRVNGNAHAATLRAMNTLAKIYEDMEDLASAVPLYEEDLSSSRQTLGSEHPDTLTSMHNLGVARCKLGGFEAAIPSESSSRVVFLGLRSFKVNKNTSFW